MRPLRHVVLSLVAPAALLGACNALSGLDQEYVLADGASSTSSSGGASSSGSGSGDGQANPDGLITSDGNVPDNTTGTDTGPVACNGALLCWDFDKEPAPLGGGWTTETVTPSAVVDLGAGVTGQGLHAKVNGNTGSSAKANLIRTISTTGWTSGKTLLLKFSIKVVTAGTDYAAFAVFEFGTPPPPTEHGLAFYLGSTQCLPGLAPCLDENEPVHRPDHTIDKAGAIHLTPLLNTWMPAEVSLTWTSGTNAFAGKVKVNGLTLDDRATNAMPSSPAPPTSVLLRMGVFFAGEAAGSTEVVIDDIVVSLN